MNIPQQLTATCKAVELKAMRHAMTTGIIRFAYMKSNGKIRYAVGTLQIDAVKANTKGGNRSKNPNVFSYLDLQRMAWRSFRVENFIGIVV